jgi:hypothetical protein
VRRDLEVEEEAESTAGLTDAERLALGVLSAVAKSAAGFGVTEPARDLSMKRGYVLERRTWYC